MGQLPADADKVEAANKGFEERRSRAGLETAADHVNAKEGKQKSRSQHLKTTGFGFVARTSLLKSGGLKAGVGLESWFCHARVARDFGEANRPVCASTFSSAPCGRHRRAARIQITNACGVGTAAIVGPRRRAPRLAPVPPQLLR